MATPVIAAIAEHEAIGRMSGEKPMDISAYPNPVAPCSNEAVKLIRATNRIIQINFMI